MESFKHHEGTHETLEELEARRSEKLSEITKFAELVGAHGEGQYGEDLKATIEEYEQISINILTRHVEDGIRRGKQSDLDLPQTH